MAYTLINPASGKLIESFEQHDDSQVEAALANAEKAFQSWSEQEVNPPLSSVAILDS